MIYLYAFTDHPELSLPALCGLEEGRTSPLELRLEAHRDLAAIYSLTPSAKQAPTSANIWRHEAVVEALMADRTVLPARFGTVIENTASLQARLASIYNNLLLNIQRLCGRLEVSLQVLWKQPPAEANSTSKNAAQPISGSGVQYMLARLQQEKQEQAVRQKAERLAARLHAPLQCLADENQFKVLPTPGLLLKAAYLIKREQLEPFRQQVDRLRNTYQQDGELNLLCTGPWPPYSFITALASGPDGLSDTQIQTP